MGHSVTGLRDAAHPVAATIAGAKCVKQFARAVLKRRTTPAATQRMPPYDTVFPTFEAAVVPPAAPRADDAATREAALRAFAAELRRANQDLEQFAYTAAHDLQEPLRLMTSFTELFVRRYAEVVDDTGREYLHYALSGARQMKALLNDLLDYTRVCNDLSPFESVSLNAVAAEVEELLRALLEDCVGTLTWGDLPTVRGNRRQLLQVFYNLVRNAINYRAAGRRASIELRAARLPSAWQIDVADNGQGIAPAYRERVFMIFQRLPRDRTLPGTGMGLAVCKKIVDHHGGRIWADPNEAGGTTIRFTLPDDAGRGELPHG
jgi:light-regulated signal transduction histidine kinase (bacteriophytochrome)